MGPLELTSNLSGKMIEGKQDGNLNDIPVWE